MVTCSRLIKRTFYIKLCSFIFLQVNKYPTYKKNKKSPEVNSRLFLIVLLCINFGVLSIFFDKLTSWRHFITHKHRKNAVSFKGIVYRDLT